MRHRVTYTTDRCTITLFTFHDGHLGLAGAKRFVHSLKRQMPGGRFAIVTEPVPMA